MKYKILCVILMSPTIFLTAQESWSSTSAEYYWNTMFNRLQFREPLSFTPLEVRIGQFSYGGEGYWSQSLLSTDLIVSPVEIDSTELSFDNIDGINSRSALYVEIDILKINIFNYLYHQNLLDVQFGLGYRNITSIESTDLPDHWTSSLPNDESNGTYKYRPLINNINYNITASYQFSHYFISYLYYNFGYSIGTIYESTGKQKYLNGQGYSEGFSFGLKYLVNPKGLPFSFTYGIDARFQRTILFDLDDSRKISHINKLDLYAKGIFLTISTTFGGKRSSADIAYKKMIRDNYLGAIPGFEKYIKDFPESNKIPRAKKMLSFCEDQSPFQKFDSALFYFNNNELETATKWISDAEKNADKDLLSEIKLYKEKLAVSIIEEIQLNEDFINSEKLYKEALELAPDYFLTQEIFSNFYIRKADNYLKKGNYDLAYKYYNKAVEIFSNNKRKVSSRYPQIIRGLLNDANQATNEGNYVLAKYSINKIIEIEPKHEAEFQSILSQLNTVISDKENKLVHITIQNMIQNKFDERRNIMDHELELGMTMDDVLELIDEPDIRDKTIRFGRAFEMWTYNNKPNIKRLFFENNFLTKVER